MDYYQNVVQSILTNMLPQLKNKNRNYKIKYFKEWING